ncbi:unnamed protein product [Rhizoctonia solani]|uniref:Non-haem dioxygenase N-terminal domain-containing protein n=1 Tax=Rhizoctonia solani TaxID=456999 RepID=A0A8H2X8K6_9AGAM|nr:unnamed protein product [Rhizoctonia solani]
MTTVDLISLADQSVRPFESIPVIDLSGLSGDAKNKARIASEIREACIHVGFFYVKNHGIDEAMIASTVDAARRFFELPLEEKMKLDAQQTSHLRGYYPPGQRRLSRESFEIGPDVDASPNIPMSGRNLWPSANVIQDFEEPVSKYYYEVTGFALKLFSAFALALNLPEDYFADKVRQYLGESTNYLLVVPSGQVQNGAATMRLAHYAPQTTVVGEQEPGIIEHTDFQCFTILWQDEHRALQVKNTSGEWIDAHPIPGTFIIKSTYKNDK